METVTEDDLPFIPVTDDASYILIIAGTALYGTADRGRNEMALFNECFSRAMEVSSDGADGRARVLIYLVSI